MHGLDAIGLLAVQMCTLEGIQQVFTVDPDPARRKLAADLGATHQPAVADRLHRRLAAPDRTPHLASPPGHGHRVSVQGLRGRRFSFDDVPAAYRWIDQHPQDAIKVALTY